MAGRRRKKQRAARRQAAAAPVQPAAGAQPAPGVGSVVVTPQPQAQAAPTTGPARYAGGVIAPRRGAVAATATAGAIDIDERVPYFARDMRRLLITAAVMLAVIIVLSFVLH